MSETRKILISEALVPASFGQDYLLRATEMTLQVEQSSRFPVSRPFQHHWHTELEITCYLSGSGIYSFPEKEGKGYLEYSIRPNDVFLFGSNEVHSMTRVDTPEQMSWISLHFEPRFIWSIGNDMFDSRYLSIFFDRGKDFSNRLDRTNPMLDKVRKIMKRIQQEVMEKPPEYALMAKACLLELLVTLKRYFYPENGEHAGYTRRSTSMKIEKAMQYIHDHFLEPVTLNDLAGISNLTDSYFSTIFKRLNGISPWEYITKMRINYAMERLKDPHTSILDIAMESGFNNPASFNRAFRKITGRSPRELRGDEHF